MKNHIAKFISAIFMSMLLLFLAGFETPASAQFPKIPKLPKDLGVKTDQNGSTTVNTPVSNSSTTTSKAAPSTDASILRRTIYVKPRRFLRYWKNPSAAEPVYDTWSWAPEIEFSIYGPVTSGSQIYVDWETADGKPWFTQRMQTPTLEPDYYDSVSHVEDINFDQLEKKAITTPGGVFPFRIRLKNALNGTDKVLFEGKYKVATYSPDPKIPEYRGKKEFFIDEDWRVPMAWLWLNPTNNENAPILNAQMWFKASTNSDNFEGFVYYNGKQIATARAGSADDVLTNGVDEKANRYSLRTFFFPGIRGFNNDTSANRYDSHFLNKNPGEYEVKVLRNGELSRTFKFTVGPDGKVVDNGYAKNNKVGGTRWIIPAKVLGTADGGFNAAPQTDAFYGNPLVGFTIAQ